MWYIATEAQNYYRGASMDNNKLIEFLIKRDMVVKEASLFNDSKFYSFTGKIQIPGKMSAEWLVNFLHESIHLYINDFLICDLKSDYAFLFNYLHYFYIYKKTEILEKSGLVKNDKKEVMNQIQYVMAYQHEIDTLLSKDNDFVEFCKFCIKVYNVYLELIDANALFNEGLATYYCINTKPDSFLFKMMGIPNIFEIGKKFDITEEDIKTTQETIKRRIRHLDDQKTIDISEMNIYEFGYEYTYLLSDLYGDEVLLLVLVELFSKAYDIYDYDLLGCSEQDRRLLIDKYFSLDKMYLDLLFKASDINKIITKKELSPADIFQLFQLVTNHTNPAQTLSDDELGKSLDRCFFKHPIVIKEVEKVLGREMAEVEYAQAMMHSALQHSGKSMKAIFENEELRTQKRADIDELIQNKSRFISDTDKYAERSFEDSFMGMKSIVRIAEENRR